MRVSQDRHRTTVRLPKWAKAWLESSSREMGVSENAYINLLIRRDMSDAVNKKAAEASDPLGDLV